MERSHIHLLSDWFRMIGPLESLIQEPRPSRYAPRFGKRSKPRIADPKKKAARKRQRKARAINKR